jgi:N-acetylglutamate synthase-like GNAT family acetyltransferase
MSIEIVVIEAEKILNEATAFYDACDRKTMIDPKDLLIVAYEQKLIVGIGRLCQEGLFYTLRTLQVDYGYQKRGIGIMLLKKFKEVADEKGIDEIYCMPYDYLDSFYGSVGFKKIDPNLAPPFLQTRLKYFHSRNAGKKAVIMAKKK